MKKKKIRISTVLLLVLLFVLLCVVAGAGWKLYRYYADYSKDRDLYSDFRDEVIKSDEKENGYYWLGIFYRTAADILSCFAG